MKYLSQYRHLKFLMPVGILGIGQSALLSEVLGALMAYKTVSRLCGGDSEYQMRFLSVE